MTLDVDSEEPSYSSFTAHAVETMDFSLFGGAGGYYYFDDMIFDIYLTSWISVCCSFRDATF